MHEYPKFEDLVGKTLTAVTKSNVDRLEFVVDDGEEYALYHSRDCCEFVYIDDITGDLADLVGTPILVAEERTSRENPEGQKVPEYQESFTWTFYELRTIKGSVTVRWYGESNGYYSESVDFARTKEIPAA